MVQSPDHQYLHLIETTEFSPVFIIGAHRSGTSILYKTLAESGCFNFVKMYHVARYDEVLSNFINQVEDEAVERLRETIKQLGIKNRIIDDLGFDPELPEEYVQILRNKNPSLRLRSKRSVMLSDDNLHLFQEICRKIQYVSDSSRTLLLKNPWDIMNFVYIKKRFPEAKFIFIHRHPVQVISSQLKALRKHFSSRNPSLLLINNDYRRTMDNYLLLSIARLRCSSFLGLGLRWLLTGSQQSTSYFLDNISSLASHDYVSIRYEDLCQDPIGSLGEIFDFLNLDPSLPLSEFVHIDSRQTDLLPEVEKQQDNIKQRVRPYLEYCGY